MIHSARLRSFNFLRRLKRNKLSSVWLVQSKTHKTYCAVKVTKKLEACRKNIIHLPVNEQSVLGSLNHALISNIIEAFQDSANLYIVLEYMPCGSLRDYLTYCGNLTESQTRISFLIQVLWSSVSSMLSTIFTGNKLLTWTSNLKICSLTKKVTLDFAISTLVSISKSGRGKIKKWS